MAKSTQTTIKPLSVNDGVALDGRIKLSTADTTGLLGQFDAAGKLLAIYVGVSMSPTTKHFGFTGCSLKSGKPRVRLGCVQGYIDGVKRIGVSADMPIPEGSPLVAEHKAASEALLAGIDDDAPKSKGKAKPIVWD